DGTGRSAHQCAYHISEIEKDKLQIDYDYYLSSELFKIIERMCEVVDEIDNEMIAASLGLDIIKHRKLIKKRQTAQFVASFENKWKNVDSLVLSCEDCFEDAEITFIFVVDKNSKIQQLNCNLICPCKKNLMEDEDYFVNSVTKIVEKLITKNEEKWWKCDGLACQYKVKEIDLSKNIEKTCPSCCDNILKISYSDSQFYSQLTFFRNLFDVDKQVKYISSKYRKEAITMVEKYLATFNKVKVLVNDFIQKCDYHWVDLAKIFVDKIERIV
ncbi:hypothetical protein A3Q56_04183, partial [Intoshia linei]